MKAQIASILCLLAGVFSVNLFSSSDAAAHGWDRLTSSDQARVAANCPAPEGSEEPHGVKHTDFDWVWIQDHFCPSHPEGFEYDFSEANSYIRCSNGDRIWYDPETPAECPPLECEEGFEDVLGFCERVCVGDEVRVGRNCQCPDGQIYDRRVSAPFDFLYIDIWGPPGSGKCTDQCHVEAIPGDLFFPAMTGDRIYCPTNVAPQTYNPETFDKRSRGDGDVYSCKDGHFFSDLNCIARTAENCGPGYEAVGSECLQNCRYNFVRDETAACVCREGTQAFFGGSSCYEPVQCNGGGTLNDYNRCDCPENKEHVWQHNGCVDKCLDTEERYRGECVPQCADTEERYYGTGLCVAKCADTEDRYRGACVPQCAANQTRQYGVCVDNCPGGEISKDGIFCVSPSDACTESERYLTRWDASRPSYDSTYRPILKNGEPLTFTPSPHYYNQKVKELGCACNSGHYRQAEEGGDPGNQCVSKDSCLGGNGIVINGVCRLKSNPEACPEGQFRGSDNACTSECEISEEDKLVICPKGEEPPEPANGRRIWRSFDYHDAVTDAYECAGRDDQLASTEEGPVCINTDYTCSDGTYGIQFKPTENAPSVCIPATAVGHPKSGEFQRTYCPIRTFVMTVGVPTDGSEPYTCVPIAHPEITNEADCDALGDKFVGWLYISLDPDPNDGRVSVNTVNHEHNPAGGNVSERSHLHYWHNESCYHVTTAYPGVYEELEEAAGIATAAPAVSLTVASSLSVVAPQPPFECPDGLWAQLTEGEPPVRENVHYINGADRDAECAAAKQDSIESIRLAACGEDQVISGAGTETDPVKCVTPPPEEETIVVLPIRTPLSRTADSVEETNRSDTDALEAAVAALGNNAALFIPHQPEPVHQEPPEENRLPEYAAPAALLGALVFYQFYPDYSANHSFNYSGENENVNWEAGMHGNFEHESFSSYVSAIQDNDQFVFESGTTYRSSSFFASYRTIEAKDYLNYNIELSAPWNYSKWEIKPNLSSEFHYDRDENHSNSEAGAGLDLEYRF